MILSILHTKHNHGDTQYHIIKKSDALTTCHITKGNNKHYNTRANNTIYCKKL